MRYSCPSINNQCHLGASFKDVGVILIITTFILNLIIAFYIPLDHRLARSLAGIVTVKKAAKSVRLHQKKASYLKLYVNS